jgi:hypothetical protein
MNYSKLYTNLISKSKLREKVDGYTEKHHITPRCLGGGDEGNNIVTLTAREHFIAHCLLSKIYPNNSKIIFALWCMCSVKQTYQFRYINSYVYEKARIAYSKHKSISQKGNWSGSRNPFYKKSRFGKDNPVYGKKRKHKLKSIEQIKKTILQKLKNGEFPLNTGKTWKLKNTTKNKMKESWTDERKKQRSIMYRGENNPSSKLTDKQRVLICSKRKEGVPVRVLSLLFNTPESTIYNIVKGINVNGKSKI